MNCRFDGLPIAHEFVDLGFSPPSNSFLTRDQLNQPEVHFPLKLFVSDRTFLVQIDEFKKHDEIFSENYVYFSSFSSSWLKHCREYVDMMVKRFGFNGFSHVVEIASNDGYLLQYFKERGVPVLGIEPTSGTAAVARKKGIETWTEFFGVTLAKKIAEQGKSADLLIGNNVLAHVPNINDFVEGLAVALNTDGIITMEFPHLYQLIKHNQFDTIYHEHFSYLSLYSVKKIFDHHQLEIFDVEEIPTHGGSLRIFARHAGSNKPGVLPSVAELLYKEHEAGMTSMAYYRGFQRKVNEVKNEFLDFLIQARREQKKVVGYGAAAKGNTLLNYCGVRPDLIEFVVDANPNKLNKFLPGSHIPVVHEDKLKQMKPDYVIIFPWNISEEIMTLLDYIRTWNGKFVTAIPRLKIF